MPEFMAGLAMEMAAADNENYSHGGCSGVTAYLLQPDGGALMLGFSDTISLEWIFCAGNDCQTSGAVAAKDLVVSLYNPALKKTRDATGRTRIFSEQTRDDSVGVANGRSLATMQNI